MELDLNSSQEFYLKKHLFNLKTNRIDGLILQIHHSYSGSAGESKKFIFIFASFSSNGNLLAVSDHKGHIFIINLESQRYWQLPQFGLPSVISFTPYKNQELLIGLDNSSVLLVDVESANRIGVLTGHSQPATEVSYSDDGGYYLTSCSTEAIVWVSSTFSQVHKLTLKLDILLKKVLFMPVTNHILACFQDDTMHIWKFGNFECIKQIIPEAWKTQHLNSIAITRDGRTMIIGGHSPNLVTFCLDTWHIKSVIEFPENISGVKQLEFLSQVFDGGENKILVVLTTLHELFFYDTESLVTLKCINQINGLAAKFSLSCNGVYFAVILTTGETNIYTVDKILWSKKQATDKERRYLNQDSSLTHSSSGKRSQRTDESLSNIQKEIKDILNVKKLLPILKQFGEYPQSYRKLIWKTILKLPENQECFAALSMKKCHPSYNKIEMKYPLTNTSLCNSLKKLLSNLSHWCPLFGEVDFLPEFVFPFVKLFHNSPLLCFEVVGTIIVNWCQNWFEFYPFPPINMLTILESVLGYHDPDLLEFYMANDITSSISVCPLFHNAFSEVLSKTQWLKLWDHVLSNEPSFLFMAIVAYNVVCRNVIKSLKDAAEIEKYFHTQHPVDLKMLIGKTYQFLRETPEDIHTRQFFGPFRPLGTMGTYICFLSYPKLIFDSNTEKLQTLRKEEEEILEEQLKALSIKRTLEEKFHDDNRMEEKKKIYRELEEKIRKTVEEEEDRLLTERQRLQNLRQELKLKELEILENTRDRVLKEKIKQKELEYERLMKDISKRQHREKLERDILEKEIGSYYSDLLLRKTQLEMNLPLNSENTKSENLEAQREILQRDLIALQYEWDNHYHNRRIDLSNKIASIKSLICDVEAEIAKELAERRCEEHIKEERTFVGELKDKVRSLENEVENLIKENLDNLQSQKEEGALPGSWLPAKRQILRNAGEVKKEGSVSTPPVKQVTNKKPVKHTPPKSPPVRPTHRRITARPRPAKASSKDSRSEKQFSDSPSEYGEGFLKSSRLKAGVPKPWTPQKRSKYTQPNELRLLNSVSRENSDNFCDTNSELIKNCHQQPKGDQSDKKFPVQKFSKNEVILNSKIKEAKSRPVSSSKERCGSPRSPKSSSSGEILKSALKVREEIVNEAKRQQGLS